MNPAVTHLLLAAVAVAGFSAVAIYFVREIALKRAWLDRPNERSSHKKPVPRLGGAAFVPVLLVGLLFLWPRNAIAMAFVAGAVLLYLVSLLDDFRPLPAKMRFSVQFAAAGGLVAVAFAPDLAGIAASPLQISLAKAGGAAILVLWLVGMINVYNFMDGIDGIAGCQAVVAGAAWLAIGLALSAPMVAWLGLLVAAAAMGFLIFNWPPASIFMGDAGSTVLGFAFAACPLLAARESGDGAMLPRLLLSGVLVVWPFLADGIFTFVRRLRRGEDVFQAHRSHIYQRLVIGGQPHRRVTCAYGGLAVLGAGLGWGVATGMPWLSIAGPIVVAGAFGGLWFWMKRCEVKT